MALGIPWAMAHGYSVGTKNHSDLRGNGCLGGSDPYPHADPSVPRAQKCRWMTSNVCTPSSWTNPAPHST